MFITITMKKVCSRNSEQCGCARKIISKKGVASAEREREMAKSCQRHSEKGFPWLLQKKHSNHSAEHTHTHTRAAQSPSRMQATKCVYKELKCKSHLLANQI